MKKAIIFTCILLISKCLFSQIIVPIDYIDKKTEADEYFYNEEYSESAKIYEHIAKSDFYRRIDFMFLAKSYFEMNLIDESKEILNTAIEQGLHFNKIEDTIYCYSTEDNYFLDYLTTDNFILEKQLLIKNTKKYFAENKDTILENKLILSYQIGKKVLKISNSFENGDSIESLLIDIQNENIKMFKEIIDKQGFPAISQVGEEAVYSAFFITMNLNSDIDFQEKCLRLMVENYKNGEIPAVCIAYLQDRILVNKNSDQIFGTQNYVENEKIKTYSVENKKKLDDRRTVMRLNKKNEFIEENIIYLE